MKQEEEKKEFDPAREWDVITATDGGVIWKNYATGSAHRIVVTRKGENPNDVADREDKEKEDGELTQRGCRDKGDYGAETE